MNAGSTEELLGVLSRAAKAQTPLLASIEQP
jgi:hypothetical protein